jgi:hypothetical protein
LAAIGRLAAFTGQTIQPPCALVYDAEFATALLQIDISPPSWPDSLLHRWRIGVANLFRWRAFNAESVVPQIVAIGGGRSPRSGGPDDCRAGHIIIAAEIATMNTEQIDALSPVRPSDEMRDPAPRSRSHIGHANLGRRQGHHRHLRWFWLEPNGLALMQLPYFFKTRTFLNQ